MSYYRFCFNVIFCCLVIVLSSVDSNAQIRDGKQWNNWYFASAAITFNTDPPTVLGDNKMRDQENCSSVSDAEGNLLFYTNGDTVWNRKHEKMGGLTSRYLSLHLSTAGSVCIKQPGQDSLYYIFQAPSILPGMAIADIVVRYAIINMNKNNGLGAIVSHDNKLVAFNSWVTGCEKLGLVCHENKNAWWIVGTNEKFEFASFLLDSAGLHKTPVISSPFKCDISGTISFSPDGKTMATPNGIYKFNNSNGKVESLLGYAYTYNMEFSAFSPNGRYLYYTVRSLNLHQIDLSQTLPTNKVFVEKLIFGERVDSMNNGNRACNALMLAPDRKIYINSNNGRYLSVIEDPDQGGEACNFMREKILLKQGVFAGAGFGLPLIPSSAIRSSFNYSRKCNSLFLYYPEKDLSDSIKWEILNKDGSSKTVVSGDSVEYRLPAKSTYKISSVKYFDNTTDTIYSEIIIDTIYDVACSFTQIKLCNDSAILTATDTNAMAYKWSAGDSTKAKKVTKAGFYWVDRFIKGCVIRDSFEVILSPKPEINLPDTVILCENESVILHAGNRYNSYLWSNGSTDSTLKVNKGGFYSVTVSNGCADSTDKIYVKEINCEIPDTSKPVLNIPECNVFIPNAFSPNNDNVNSSFSPVTNCNINKYNFQIYNRWGERIFNSSFVKESWDGRFKEKICPEGCYIYTLSLQKQSGEWVYKSGIFYLLK